MFDIRTDPRRWRLLVVPLGAVALVGLAGCGTSGTSTGSSSASASASTEPTAGNAPRAAFRTCLANNGVTLPERPGRRAGSGGMTGDGNGAPPSGAPMAPPQGGQGGGGAGRGLDRPPPGVDATTWAAALKACASLAPTPPAGAARSATPAS